METSPITNEALPVKPSRPLESECCGTGCTPCVFDIYEKQVKKWEEECSRILSGSKNLNNGEISEGTRPADHLIPEKFQSFKLLEIIPETASASIYRFGSVPVTDGEVIPQFSSSQVVKIGQHVVMKIGDVAKQYTVLTVGSTPEYSYFDIVIRIYPKGILTPLIGQLVQGDSALMRGPSGRVFDLKPNAFQFVIILAAGTGIAPMYRIIESILNNEDDTTRVKLIYCNRSVDSILLKSKLREWSSFWNFQVTHYLTRNGNAPIPYGMDIKFKKFSFQDFAQLCSVDDNNTNSYYLVCGTKSFEKDMLNYMNRSGIKPERQYIF